MDPASLVFLDSPDAMRMVAAWPLLGEDRSVQAWADMANVAIGKASRIAPALLASGICRAGGESDPMAMTYLAAKTSSWRKKR